MTFDPEGTFTDDSSVFGMPEDNKSLLYLLPISWEPTTSFKKGTAKGPKALFEASKQMDLYHPYFRKTYEKGIYWKKGLLEKSSQLNEEAKPLTEKIINALERGNKADVSKIQKVNAYSKELNTLVYESAKKALSQKKCLGLVGGDHSCPFGLIKALHENSSEDFSIIHIDAHFDFRNAYQGFEHSHASIMYNVRTKLEKPPSIYQLGIRDFCESELAFANENSTYMLDSEFMNLTLNGKSFDQILERMFANLSKNIYISFDVDGLSPEFCPNTGTPVPGGLTYHQALYIIRKLHSKGHKLIGFDLVEISPGQNEEGEGLDEVIGARLLYELSLFSLASF